MGRIEKLKRQAINEANIRVLNEQESTPPQKFTINGILKLVRDDSGQYFKVGDIPAFPGAWDKCRGCTYKDVLDKMVTTTGTTKNNEPPSPQNPLYFPGLSPTVVSPEASKPNDNEGWAPLF